MDHAVLVRVVECVRDFGRDAHRLVDAELGLAVELLPDRLALDVGHHVIKEAVGLSRVEQGENVGMTQRRGGLDFLHEALGTQYCGQLGAEDLDGDLAVVLDVGGEVDGGHAALAELALDRVAVGEGRGETVSAVTHLPTRSRNSLVKFRIT